LLTTLYCEPPPPPPPLPGLKPLPASTALTSDRIFDIGQSRMSIFRVVHSLCPHTYFSDRPVSDSSAATTFGYSRRCASVQSPSPPHSASMPNTELLPDRPVSPPEPAWLARPAATTTATPLRSRYTWQSGPDRPGRP